MPRAMNSGSAHSTPGVERTQSTTSTPSRRRPDPASHDRGKAARLGDQLGGACEAFVKHVIASAYMDLRSTLSRRTLVVYKNVP